MQEYIKIYGAKEHNLKNININIPKNKLVVLTGLSGSGKSSLAFDTIYAEGQRRYVESLSAYARQFLHLQNKPNVDKITGLSPAIAIEQKTTSKNPRSTVGTVTEIYDYLRLLYARIGIPYSPVTGLPIENQSISEMVDIVNKLPIGTKINIISPIIRGQKGEFRRELHTIQRQGFQRLIIDKVSYDIDNIPNLDKNKKHTIEVIIDRVIISENLGNRLADSFEIALNLSNGIAYIEIIDVPENENQYKKNQTINFSAKYSCPVSGFQVEEIEPRIFSFNSPFGACKKCEGLGKTTIFDPELIAPNKNISIKDGAILVWENKLFSKNFLNILEALSKHYNFSLDTPLYQLEPKIIDMLFFGSKEELIKFSNLDSFTKTLTEKSFAGIIPSLEEKLKNSDTKTLQDQLLQYKSFATCSTCNGSRLKQESLSIKIAKLNIHDIAIMDIATAHNWFLKLSSKLSKKHAIIGEKIIKEIIERLSFLINVGLEYLTLSRESGTLSGGESQRIRLASQIGSGLSGVLYVLDEPSIGLHQRDNKRLIQTLKNLKNLGNTVLVVEHDEETMYEADHIIDIGLGAGIHGGNIIFEGNVEQIKSCKESYTGQYLNKDLYIPIPDRKRVSEQNKKITLINARSNNLQNINLDILLGTFTSVTGISGSGKSTLIIDTLYKGILKKLEPNTKIISGEYDKITGIEYINKIIDINQSPIGRTPRSNPATYTGVFTLIRDLFVELPESKIRGYKLGRFSFNVKGGRCESCQGEGLIKIEMHFLSDIYVKCDICNGKRYNRETLEIKYKNKSISDVLDMTVEDGLNFFSNISSINEKLSTLYEVGLGYIKIGQAATTLSGGEAQRIKLAKELSKKSTGKTLYILDEPTTGLHTHDIAKLLKILHKLVDMGNTVVIIEHNLEVIKTSDYIIDIGPEGGHKGGKIIATGTPQELIKIKDSYTAQYLKKYFKT